MAVTKISALPTPPQTTDASNFDSRADKFVAALPNFVDECNNYAKELTAAQDATIDTINTAKNAASTDFRTLRDDAEKSLNSALNKQLAEITGNDAVLQKLTAALPLTSDLQYIVGPSADADFATINEALAESSKRLVVVSNAQTYKVSIQLEQGFVWAETVNLRNIKLDQVSLTMKAPASVTTENDDGTKTTTTPETQPIQVKLSALKPFELHGSKYTSLICLDNASLSIDSLDLQVMAETDLSEANNGTIELIKLCDNSTLYAKSFTLDSSKISAATNDYKALYMLTNSVFFGTSLSLTFDNTLKTSQPAVWIKDKSSVSFDSITINGSEPDALVKEKAQRLYGVVVTNQSIFYTSNTMTIKALNYGIRLEYSTIGFEIYEHSNALVSIAANVSTIARGNMSISQQLTSDDNATQTALELTNSTLKAINITFSGIGFLSSSDSEIDVFGFVNLTSTQPQKNVKNTWKCDIKGGSCNINTLKYTPQVAGTNDFISYPKLTAASEYSGLVNAGEGVNFKVLFVDISNITLQWLQLSGETQAANPKGLFSFGGGRFQISKASKLSDFSGAYIDTAGTSSAYGLKLYAAAAMPNMLSQLALGDFSVLTENHSNLDEANPVTQLATGTLALIAKGKPPAPTLSFNAAGSGVTSGEMNFGFWWSSAANTSVATILGYQTSRASKSIEIYADRDLTGYSVSVEKGGIFKAKYYYYDRDNNYYYDYDYDYDYEFAAKIEGNKITLTIYGLDKPGYQGTTGRYGRGDYFTSCITCVLNSTIKVIDAAGNQSNAITLKVGSW